MTTDTQNPNEVIAKLEKELKEARKAEAAAVKRAEKTEEDLKSQSQSAEDVVAKLKATMKERLTEAEKKIREQNAKIDELKPTVDVRRFLFTEPDDVVDFFGEKNLRDMAKATLQEINITRLKQGLDRVEYTPEEAKQALDETVQQLLNARYDPENAPPESGPLMRMLKMVHPKTGALMQIPYEGQFNNIAGSLQDGFALYANKGFKRTEPFLCPTMNCWEVAEVVESGKKKGEWAFEGYCTQDHLDRTERRNSAALPGVTTRDEFIGRPAR